jgi:hypothetical protein
MVSSSSTNNAMGCIRKFERTCCNIVTYFPLVFVYSLSTWAVWVQASMALLRGSWLSTWHPLLPLQYVTLT